MCLDMFLVADALDGGCLYTVCDDHDDDDDGGT